MTWIFELKYIDVQIKKNIPKIFKDRVKTNWYALAKTFNEHKDLKM